MALVLPELCLHIYSTRFKSTKNFLPAVFVDVCLASGTLVTFNEISSEDDKCFLVYSIIAMNWFNPEHMYRLQCA